ncbi:MAG: PD-(D/E)XK nuclease family protein, partial [Acidimicrobiia bacterium]|nr:PD-(D/E)XK nuclease family protein [Acidimicrobiia bacterium]
VPFGRPATRALSDAIRALEGDDRLAPVTVVVPSNLAGLTARRLLAAGGTTEMGDRPGLVNVTFLTPYQLAARLASAAMAQQGRLPLTGPVLHAALRSALADHDGAFARVARHGATELALARVYGELARAEPDTLDRLRASGRSRTRDLLALVDDARARLTTHHDEDELVAAAVARLAESAASEEVGSLVVHLIDDVSPAVRRFLAHLASMVPARVVVGLTGDDDADTSARSVASAMAPAASGSVPRRLAGSGTRLVETADPDEEVRAVVREIAAGVDAGLRLDRMAVLYPMPDPYLRTLHDQLDAAGLAHNGPAGRPLADAVVGRLVRSLLEQVQAAGDEPRHLLGRQQLVDIVSAAPVADAEGRPVPATSYDLLSRRAGVIGGLDDWADKLGRHRANLIERRDRLEREGASAGQLGALDREAADTERLADFVADLGARLDPTAVGSGWHERAVWLVGLLDHLLPPEHRRQQWPDDEIAAGTEIVRVIERVSVLDQFDPDASFAAFARTIESELEVTGRRRGRFGHGVLVAPLVAAAGLDVERVYVLGCSEGILPPARREDGLLPDDERQRATQGELALRRARTATDRRDFLAALQVATDAVVLVHSAGDHRTGKRRRPSRWLLEVAAALIQRPDRPLLSSEWPAAVQPDHPLAPHLTQTRSFHEGIERAAAPASLLDRDLARLLAHRESGQPIDAHHVVAHDMVLARGLALARGRDSAELTRFDGNLGHGPRPDSLLDGVLSATRLETWATCPMRYFLGNELGLGDVERPEEIVELSALDRGSLVHLILEDFLTLVVARPKAERPGPATPWTDGDRRQLLSIAGRRFAEFEDRGLTGKPLLWRVHAQRLLADLEQWLVADEQLRLALDTVPDAVELRVGFADQPPAEIALSDGRVLRFRGIADRVDVTGDGTPVVIDYKTGRAVVRQKDLDDDPVQRGTRLQLGLYAASARRLYGSEHAAAYYWYTSEKGGFRRVGYEFTPAREQRFTEVVSTIVEGIESGLFVTNSGGYDSYFGTFDNCRHCDFDRLCPRDRAAQSDAKQDSPDAALFVGLAGREP